MVSPFICFFSSGGSTQGNSTQTTTSTSQPWSGQQPYLTAGFQQAQNLLDQPAPTQQNPIVPMNGAQTAALSGITQTAADGTPITGAATNFATNLENGAYMGANPALSYFAQLANSNLGLSNPGASSLYSIANGQGAGSDVLSSIANGGAGALPGTGTLSTLSGSNPGTSNAGQSILQMLAGNNAGTSGSGFSTLQQLLQSNPGTANSGTAALQSYANGDQLNSNGYTDDTAKSIESQVIPDVAAAFNRGNAINNPAAARAAAEGVTAALAPVEYQNYQTQEGLQTNAAQQLASNTISGANSQATFANLAQQLGLSGAQLQGSAGQDLAGNAISGTTAQGNIAQALASLGLGGQQLQTTAASDLASNANSAAGNLNSGAIAGGNLQDTAATGISGDFQDTLAKMVQGNALAPQNQALSYADLQQLYGAGTAAQTQAQNQATGAAQTANYAQLSPYQQLQSYMQAIGGNYGTTSSGSTTTPYYTNPASNAMGGALGGLALASAFPATAASIGGGGVAAGLGALLAFL